MSISPLRSRATTIVLDFLTSPVTSAWNSSSSHSLDQVKTILTRGPSNITPVHKKGDKVLLTNYRPVALTSVLCKVLERIITVVLNNHLNTFALLNPYQHGFVKHRSCVTQLVNIIQSWSSTLDRRRPPRVDAVFLDMSKAFDTMPHHILLEKLATSFNVRGKLWCWVRSFLTDHKQRVLFRGGVSSWVNITSGVPQVSVLGPLLFNFFC